MRNFEAMRGSVRNFMKIEIKDDLLLRQQTRDCSYSGQENYSFVLFHIRL